MLNTSGLWQCPACQAWVPDEQSHACGGSQYRAHQIHDPSVLERIAAALELQARIRDRWPAILARARELEKITHDPIESMIRVLGDLPGDYADWREIVEEPYG